jgi:nanoRNase/pAp phosphatase (c-di-AMP/oligoRNAs hydrolase)
MIQTAWTRVFRPFGRGLRAERQEWAVTQHVDGLLKALEKSRRLLVVIHDNPDPDALASACALQRLAEEKAGTRSRVCCEPIAGRAENRAMIRELRLNLLPVSRVNWDQWPLIALLDTQPDAGNNSFPPRRMPDIVIDHHPLRPKTRARFLDVRTGYGACATILAEHLRAASVAPSPALAAAMCYAISAETQDLVRPGAEADTRAYAQLYPLADKRMLGRILHPRRTHSYFATLARAMLCAFTYGNIIGCHLGDIPHPDSVGLIADLLLRHERMGWSIVTGAWQGSLYVSLRARSDRAHAGIILARILRKIGRAGGHGTMAAGRVPLKSPEPGERERLEKEIVLHLVHALHRRSEVTLRPLISPEELGGARNPSFTAETQRTRRTKDETQIIP